MNSAQWLNSPALSLSSLIETSQTLVANAGLLPLAEGGVSTEMFVGLVGLLVAVIVFLLWKMKQPQQRRLNLDAKETKLLKASLKENKTEGEEEEKVDLVAFEQGGKDGQSLQAVKDSIQQGSVESLSKEELRTLRRARRADSRRDPSVKEGRLAAEAAEKEAEQKASEAKDAADQAAMGKDAADQARVARQGAEEEAKKASLVAEKAAEQHAEAEAAAKNCTDEERDAAAQALKEAADATAKAAAEKEAAEEAAREHAQAETAAIEAAHAAEMAAEEKAAAEKLARENAEKAAEEAEKKRVEDRIRRKKERRAKREKLLKEQKEREEQEAEEAKLKAEKRRAEFGDSGEVSAEVDTIKKGLTATRQDGFVARLNKLFRRKTLGDDIFEEIEEILFTADIGVQTSENLIKSIEAELKGKDLKDPEKVMGALRSSILRVLKASEEPMIIDEQKKPYVILVIGVNGAGKTTSIGKIASRLKDEGKEVLLIAGDTFRAAAIEQLEEWSERTDCPIHKGNPGDDPSAVIYDGLKLAQKEGYDVVIADTAGRLHNNETLREELKKVGRVTKKALPGAPHRVLLVLDATNGQNALRQAHDFRKAIDYTGIVMTKLDGTAKGGVIIGICDELKKPVHFIGIGERVDDLRPFRAEEFVDALF